MLTGERICLGMGDESSVPGLIDDQSTIPGDESLGLYGAPSSRSEPRFVPKASQESIKCFFRSIYDCDETPRALDWVDHAVEHLTDFENGGAPPMLPGTYDCNECGLCVDHGTWEAVFHHVLCHIRDSPGRQWIDRGLLTFLMDHGIISDAERSNAAFLPVNESPDRTHDLGGMGAAHYPLRRGSDGYNWYERRLSESSGSSN
jgi:hypothetical protein